MHEPLIPPGGRSTQALGQARLPARLQHLGVEHERLRKKVLQRRRELERFEADLREIGAIVAGRAGPLIEEALRLDAAIHASFAHILGNMKLSRHARRDVRGVYETLEAAGILTPHDVADALGAEDGGDWSPDWAGQEDRARRPAGPGGHAETPPGARPDEPEGPEGHDGEDARTGHLGRAAHLRDLRKTFLTLADAIHPDKVQSEEEKRARTEAMKELNRAYREGDLARILEIERAWNLESKLQADADDDEVERRCQALERKNALLTEQFRELGRTLGSLRRTMPGAVVIDVRRLRRERDPDPIATVLAPLELELEILRNLDSHVRSFQNGEMSLGRFLEGPELAADDLFDDEDEDDILDELLAALQEDVMRVARRARKKRGGKKGRRKK